MEFLFFQIDCSARLIKRKASNPKRAHAQQAIEYRIRALWDEENLIITEVLPSEDDVRRGEYLTASFSISFRR
jgi:hypothetical protein